MKRAKTLSYGTVFRRVRNKRSMAELRTDGVAGCLLNKALFGFGDAVCIPVISWLARHYLNPLLDELTDKAKETGRVFSLICQEPEYGESHRSDRGCGAQVLGVSGF